MGNTTRLAIPYAEPSDAVAVYPATDKAAAERVELVMPQIARGLVSAVWTNSNATTVAITFPAGRFSAAPTIVASPRTSRGIFAYVSAGLTANGATLSAVTMDKVVIGTGTFTIDYIATYIPDTY